MKKVHGFRHALYIYSTLAIMASQIGCSDRSSPLEKIHFYTDPDKRSEDPEEILTYGLFINAPWEKGGALYLNFPEHLEYNPVGNTILRHYDSIPNPWIISPDGKQASYRVESLALKDIYVESFARVMNDGAFPFDAQGVHVAMKIINHGSQTLPVIRPLICNQFRDLIEKDMDAALSIVTSMDHERKVIFWLTPGKSMIANTFIP